MGHIIADLKETFRRGNIFIQLIYINVGIFLIGTLINVFLRLFEVSTPDIFGIFALPASFIGFPPRFLLLAPLLYLRWCWVFSGGARHARVRSPECWQDWASRSTTWWPIRPQCANGWDCLATACGGISSRYRVVCSG